MRTMGQNMQSIHLKECAFGNGTCAGNILLIVYVLVCLSFILKKRSTKVANLSVV